MFRGECFGGNVLKRFVFCIAAVLALSVLVVPALSQEDVTNDFLDRVISVSADHDSCDDGFDRTENMPYCTLGRALSESGPGDIIELYDGNYGPGSDSTDYSTTAAYYNFTNEGIDDITIRAREGQDPIINCSGSDICLIVRGNVRIEGLDFTGIGGRGLIVSGSNSDSQAHIIGNSFRARMTGPDTCIGIVAANPNTNITENYFHMDNCRAIYLHKEPSGSNPDNVLIERNVLESETPSQEPGIFAECNQARIINNTITGFGEGVYVSGGTGATIERNLILGDPDYDSGIGIRMQESAGIEITRNTIMNLGGEGIMIESSEARVFDNIIHNVGHGGGAGIHIDPYSSVESDYNLIHSASGFPINYGTHYYGEPGTDFLPVTVYVNSSGNDINSWFSLDPEFANTMRGNVMLPHDSPLCGASSQGLDVGAYYCDVMLEDPFDENSCTPRWDCEWGPCVNNMSNSSCIDLNSCNMPVTSSMRFRQCVANEINADRPAPDDGNLSIIGIVQPVGSDNNTTMNRTMNRTRGMLARVIANSTVTVIPENATEEIEVNILEPDISVQRIRVRTRDQIRRIRFDLMRYNQRPDAVPIEPYEPGQGKVYQYLNISLSEIEEDVDHANVSFRVNRSWIEENGFLPGDIMLVRYKGVWDPLPTVMVNQTDDEFFYEAQTTGFSIFSIMAGSMLSPTNKTCIPFDFRCQGSDYQECRMDGGGWETEKRCEFGCSEPEGCLESGENSGESGNMWLAVSLLTTVMIILALLAFYFQSKRESLTKEIDRMRDS